MHQSDFGDDVAQDVDTSYWVVGLLLLWRSHQGILQRKEGPCNRGLEVEVQPDAPHNYKKDKEMACADERVVAVVDRHWGYNEDDNVDEDSSQVVAAARILGDSHRGRVAYY